MKRIIVFFRRRAHGTLLATVAAAVLVLLALQSWWLVKLEQAASTADRSTLANYLDTVVVDLVSSFGSAAERTLKLPASLIAGDRLEEAAAQFRRSALDGARTFFVQRFDQGRFGRLLFYDRDLDEMTARLASDETRAITVACTPWQQLAFKGVEVDAPRLQVEERDLQHRVVLLPIVGTDAHVVGVAGLVLDDVAFRERIVPLAIERALPRYFPSAMRGTVTVRVADGQGTVLHSTQPTGAGADEVTRRLPLVFTDWTLSVSNVHPHSSTLARNWLWFSLSLSGAAALALLAGLGLALRTAGREMRLSQLKSDFVSNVSHELRTPLASIRVFAEFLHSGRVTQPEKVQEYGGLIDAESRGLSKLVDTLLDFARIESGQKRYQLQPTDIVPLVTETVTSFRSRAERHGARLQFDLPAAAVPTVDLDPDALTQALGNLLDNAVKYSGGAELVTVRLEPGDLELVISVTDHGIGIPPHEHARVFERFHRVGSSLVHDIKGSGLGLAIVQHIMQAHGGRITLDSAPGQGSTFRLHFPLHPKLD